MSTGKLIWHLALKWKVLEKISLNNYYKTVPLAARGHKLIFDKILNDITKRPEKPHQK